MNILIINGPNINMLGKRETAIYGDKSYKDLIQYIKSETKDKKIKLSFFQTNHEGKIIDYLQKKYKKIDGIVINPGALTHYSYAIRDCLMSIHKPTIEVHLSNINDREDFRKISVIKDIVNDTIIGEGFAGYTKAINKLTKVII
ncbi:MAG: type II 3-dehydroquinate dehydratase [Tenericutes bacterium]|jgi:3-dehydroquinate dehydratase-2|nr:type II 3-dehydroquinate dehydratase [Mycoplasmatota bacterium]